LGLLVVGAEPDLRRQGVVVDQHRVPGRKRPQFADRCKPLPLVRFGTRLAGCALRHGGTDGLAFTDEVGEDLKKVWVGHAGEQDTGDVVVEDGSGVVSPPPADDLSIVLKDRDELYVAGAEGGLGQFGERRRVGRLGEQQQQRLRRSLLLLDALPHSDDQCVDETHEDWPQLVLDVFGADDVDGVIRVEQPVEIKCWLLQG